MSYENAPATEMLASNCAFCARPLVDSQSVEVGVGPVCRKRYMVADLVNPDIRKRGNKLIHMIALKQRGPEVEQAIETLKRLGFARVVERIRKRIKTYKKPAVGITYRYGRVFIQTPWVGGAFNDLLLAWRGIPGRRWEGKSMGNSFPMDQKRAIFNVLKRFFLGREAIGPKGEFTIA
jgi:hypothetical protein